jgi:hypothetical protein
VIAGVLLALAGVAAYAGQLVAGRLFTPWYLPATGTLGVLLIVAALWQRRGILRFLALLFVVLLSAGEWSLLIGSRLPAYSGPLAVGQPVPAFTTQRADGSTVTQRDLEGEQTSVVVFFRGRW